MNSELLPYKARGGESGVDAYRIGKDFIDVEFGNTVYHYTYSKPGRFFVEQMKKLAKSGQGLSTFISQYVREKYASKRQITSSGRTADASKART